MKKTVPITADCKDELLEAFQKIDFSDIDSEDSYELVAKDVVVIPSPGDHDTGSSKVKLHNIVDYTWEERFYSGQLLAVHVDGIYVAYGIKAQNKTVDIVRVVNTKNEARSLIKGMEGTVQDIAFSHIPREVILASMDLKGNVFIHRVTEEFGVQRLLCELLLHILPDVSYVHYKGDFSKVTWCPFIPEIPDDTQDVESMDSGEEISWLLALTRGNKIELWNVKLVMNNHETGPVTPGQVDIGYLEIMQHKKPIVSASFSPDGTAIATASLDGEIKFFQVYMQNEEKPRCLHHWQPHGGEPLASLFFLDNHRNYNPEVQFWKFAITGAKNNSELKLWSCESWTCLQTVAFKEIADRPIKLSASIDLASGYLLLSDFYHKILYVLQLFNNYKDSTAAITSISEFLLPYPILSFGIVDAGLKRFKSDNLEEVCSDDEDGVVGVFITMYLVQPKSLQDGQISFIPPEYGSFDTAKLLPIKESPFYVQSPESSEIEEDLLTSNLNQPELPANHNSLQLNLMTPDAFNSPVKHETSGSSLIKTLVEEPSYSNSTTLVASPHSPDEADSNLLTGGAEISNVLAGYGFASGGSSPSREVQEILSEGKCFYQETDEIQQDQDQAALTLTEENTVSTVWPEIPMLKMTDVRKNEEHSHKTVKQVESSGGGDVDVWKLNQRLETSISSMINVMNSLMQASEEQANELKQLREEMHQQHLLREIDKIITNFSQQQTLLLEKVLVSLDNKQQEAALTAAVTQSVSSFLSTKFLDSVTNEIPKTVLPAVVNQMETLKQQVLIELSQKLTTTDYLLKENITKMVNSDSVMKVLSSAVVSSLTPIISQCYKEYFTTIALPSLEKTCSAMFSQINETFSKGSKDYVSLLEAQSRRMSEKNREQSAQLQALSEILKNSATETNKDLQTSIANIEKQLMESVTRALSVHQATLEGSVMAAVRSRSVTPAPHIIDTQLQQTQILQLISQGQVNSAFQQALSASDLSLVVFICEKVNPQQLFSQVPCPLQQHVLLSLIQQLSADMNNHTEIKHKYLEEALMNLDVNNTVTREHLPIVLSNLQRQLQAYISSNPNNRITRSMRILLMASQALLSNAGASHTAR